MLNWHKLIYLGEDVKDEYEKIRAELDKGSYLRGVYMITLAENPIEQLDILNSLIYAANSERYSNVTVVGLAKGYEQAKELVARMAEDVYSKSGAVGIRGFFEEAL